MIILENAFLNIFGMNWHIGILTFTKRRSALQKYHDLNISSLSYSKTFAI